MSPHNRNTAHRYSGRIHALVVGFFAALAVGAISASYPAVAATSSIATNLYVNPVKGSDTATGSATAPLLTLQAALNRVKPGTVVHLEAGTYDQNVVTKVAGLASDRIVVEGPSTGTATLFGTSHVLAVKHSYYTFKGFSIDGQRAVEAQRPVSSWPTSIASMASFKSSISSIVQNDRLIYIDSGSSASGVKDTVIDHMTLTGAGGECIRIRNNATGNTVENSVIRYCGMAGVAQSGVFTYHNGEGVYIGTSPKSTSLAGAQDDASAHNALKHDTIATHGSECVDIKENANHNTLSDSECSQNTEPLADAGSNVELRGYANTIEGNSIFASASYGIKISSDTATEDLGRNRITSNTFAGQVAGALYDRSAAPSGQTCGNVVSGGTSPGNFIWIHGWSSPCPL
jgi:hypothetical protein